MIVNKFLHKAAKVLSDNSPAILTALGVTGVVSTAVMAVKATPAAYTDILNAKSEQTDPLRALDKVRLTWKYYIPAAAIGSATIACIIGANSISSKRHASLIAAYSLTEASFRDYKDQVIETLGETKEQKVVDEVARKQIERNPASAQEIIITGNGDILCHDSLTGRYFQSSMESIRKAQNDINAQTINYMYASQNEFYSLLGLPLTGYGEEVGWRSDHMLEIDFSTILSEDGRPCLSLNYRVSPIRGYYKEGRY